MDTAHKEVAPDGGIARPDKTLPPFVAYQVEEDSRANAPLASGAAGEHYRHGKVEAETRRISDEVTREAQSRRRAAQAAILGGDAEGQTFTVLPETPMETSLPTPKPMRNFLAPLDGTLQGERVLPYVTELAKLMRAYVLLAHITPTEPPSRIGHALRVPGVERYAAQQAFAPEALLYLRHVKTEMLPEVQQVDTLHITAPTVAQGLVELEMARDIDLLLVALGVHSETDRMKVGRVADNLIRFGSAPVLVIPPEADAGVRPFVLRHILVTLDGSPLAEQALGSLMGLLRQLQDSGEELPDVTLLAVAEDYALVQDYQTYLDATAGTLAALPQFARVRVQGAVTVGSAPGAIVGAVEHGIRVDDAEQMVSEPAVDLLLMTTHGRGGVSRWLFGSVADYVLPRVRVPVLLTRPGSEVVI